MLVTGGLIVATLAENRALTATPIENRGDVHPALVLLVVPAGTALFGVLGLIAAVPVTLFLLTVIRPILDTLDIGPAVAAATRKGGPTWAVPAWLDRLAQVSWRGLVVVALAVLGINVIILVPVIVVPVVLAIVIAATLLPLLNALLRRGWTRGLAAAVTTGGATIAVVTAVLATVVWTVGPLRELTGTAVAGAREVDTGWLSAAVAEVTAFLSIGLGEIVRGVTVVGLGVVLLLLLTFFFLRDGGTFWDEATDRLRGARREHLDEAGERAVGVLSGYMVGTALISLFGAVTSALIMVRPGPAARPADRDPDLLRRVHPVHRLVHHDRARVPGRGGGGNDHGHRDHGRLHDRVQPDPGQLRRPDRVRPGPEPPSGDRAGRGPGGRRRRRDPRHVPRRARGGDRVRDLAARGGDDRRRRPAT